MPRYFYEFPKLLYTRDGVTNLVTNLLTRIATVKGEIDTSALYYEYVIKDGDTPEIIASKYYGDAELHWVVLIFNDIIDPFYDWPMEYRQFIKFLTDKYGSPATAQTTIHHYEKTVQTTDNTSGEVTTRVYTIDLESYNDLPAEPTEFINNMVTEITSRGIVYSYDYENELNESKRQINLVRKELIGVIKDQFKQLMSV
jgi:hypothetical protein